MSDNAQTVLEDLLSLHGKPAGFQSREAWNHLVSRARAVVLAEASTPPPAAPAPITASDVRAAERAWAESDRYVYPPVPRADKAAFVAEWLNRRSER